MRSRSLSLSFRFYARCTRNRSASVITLPIYAVCDTPRPPLESATSPAHPTGKRRRLQGPQSKRTQHQPTDSGNQRRRAQQRIHNQLQLIDDELPLHPCLAHLRIRARQSVQERLQLQAEAAISAKLAREDMRG